MNIVEKARAFATEKHAGQTRWGGEPYITHPEAVVKSLIGEDDLPEIHAAAWLHDVMEDCGVTPVDLMEIGMPGEVIEAVELLTKKEGQSYLDYILAIKNASCPVYDIAKVVKVEDLRHNLRSSAGLKNKNSIRGKWELAFWILTGGRP